MKFIIDPKIFSFFPDMSLVVAIPEILNNVDPQGKVSEFWRKSWKSAGSSDLENAQSHPHVKQLRQQFQAIGVSHKKFPTSIEALLRRALKGGDIFSINPVVDFYNAVSLNHIVAAGAFDLEHLEGDIKLRLTETGDHFTALGQERPMELEPGEVAYASDNMILTRHFMWRQARKGLVDLKSSKIFLISEVPSIGGKEMAIRVEKDFREGLQQIFGVSSQTFIIDSSQSLLEF